MALVRQRKARHGGVGRRRNLVPLPLFLSLNKKVDSIPNSVRVADMQWVARRTVLEDKEDAVDDRVMQEVVIALLGRILSRHHHGHSRADFFFDFNLACQAHILVVLNIDVFLLLCVVNLQSRKRTLSKIEGRQQFPHPQAPVLDSSVVQENLLDAFARAKYVESLALRQVREQEIPNHKKLG